MKRLVLLAFILMTTNVSAQYIKVDNGVVFSSFHNPKDLSVLSSDKLVSYSILLGADYLEKDWFYLSSQVGYVKLGGKETNSFPQEEFNNSSESGSYVHLNTTFRAYTQSGSVKLFAGVGPFVNILTSNKTFSSPLYTSVPGYRFKSVHIGGKPELGITYDQKKFRIGLTGTYMLGLSPSATSEFLSLYNNAFSLMATVAYRIK